MIRIGVIAGSTRPGRKSDAVARWVRDIAAKRDDATAELVDLRDHRLPHLDSPLPPSIGPSTNPTVRRWAGTIAALDAFVFVTPEYNHSIPGVLKDAVDYLYQEWHNKSAGLVSYGMHGGTRAAEHLRLVLAQVEVADVRSQVALSLHTDFVAFRDFRPAAHQEAAVSAMLDQVVAWGRALRGLRRP
ncbi:NAD(P)H-dependent FMN reductase [Micromonospora nigra]|uniref:NAD(P)H-dependent FMN reductase n=1 Tax=Micromonospora nigra TaxID=145857 RepID=A0A1C6RAP0_9ACTN|nr:NAD(P)H-dependent oxidoreductase [Micromonospora nigra]SCL14200.1 NAD(P)H-dependent FMN reductase [Micromonospora nigra]